MTQNSNTSDMTCREALEKIVAYLDNEASAIERQVLERHLETCRHCFDRMEFEKLVRERLRRLSVDPSSEALTQRIEALLRGYQWNEGETPWRS